MIKVLFFAELQENVGKNELEFSMEEGDVLYLKQQLENDYPTLHLNKVMTAVNEEYANDEDPVRTGDTVAFIPPVSGG